MIRLAVKGIISGSVTFSGGTELNRFGTTGACSSNGSGLAVLVVVYVVVVIAVADSTVLVAVVVVMGIGLNGLVGCAMLKLSGDCQYLLLLDIYYCCI